MMLRSKQYHQKSYSTSARYLSPNWMSIALIQIVQTNEPAFCKIIHFDNYISEYLVKLIGTKVASLDFQGREK